MTINSFCVLTSSLDSAFWEKFIYESIRSIILVLITAFITSMVANKVFKSTRLSNNLGHYGIKYVGSHGNARLRRQDIAKLFGIMSEIKPTELCFFYITGNLFFNDYLEKYIVPLAQKGCHVKILVADYRNSRFVNEDGELVASNEEMISYYRKVISGVEKGGSFLDRSTALLGNRGLFGAYSSTAFIEKRNHVKQAIEISRLIKRVNAENEKKLFYHKIEVRYYLDEYRIPLTIAKYKDGNVLTRVWTNLANPIQEAVESINVYAEQTKFDYDNESAAFVINSVASFDYVWKRYENTSMT